MTQRKKTPEEIEEDRRAAEIAAKLEASHPPVHTGLSQTLPPEYRSLDARERALQDLATKTQNAINSEASGKQD